MDDYLADLDRAYAAGDVDEVMRINKLIYESLGDIVSESSLDYELINSLKGKAIYKNLVKAINGDELKKYDLIKLLSSLITHITIECDLKGKNLKDFPIKTLLNSLDTLVYGDGGEDNVKKFLREKYSRYI
jgi:cellulose synthase/poly-beta-1,6-N-acetylglucosamine synthase-like glycosyltransferase